MQWPKTPPGPELPLEVVEATRAKYREAYRILAGANWIRKPGPHTVSSLAERAIVKDQLEGLVNQMVERGILFDEAVGELRSASSNACWTAPTATSLRPLNFLASIAIH